ncbi:MAG: hypothetical protein HF314_12770 [Ignavibacteria bacterium]|jgi:hypothetical protein|nr:hypothetical protein [Ignavibacteria bacterium]MCU7503947.1 hypothetical protein [Ignavibacteria bacterium]MCU7515832.1 hypothetical protein [Ignavibacteria bacterium]
MRIVSSSVLLLILLGTVCFAQAESGAYVAAAVKSGSIVGRNSLIAGGRAGWSFGKKIFLGGAFYSLVNEVEMDQKDPLTNRKLLAGFNCGGLELEYIYPLNELFHGSILLFMGGGGLKPKAKDLSVPHTSYYGQSLLVWEPQVNVELNLTKLLHLGLGVSYRFVTGVDGYQGLQNKDLSSVNSLITLRFGSL